MVSYVLAGSFIRYLIERYGIDTFKDAYAWGELGEAYGRTRRELLQQWRQFLTRVEVADDAEMAVRYYFHRPSIFQKECARVLANINREARLYFRKKEYRKAIELFERSYTLSGNPGAMAGLVHSHYGSEDWGNVERIALTALGDSLLAPSLAALRLYLGDAYWATDQYQKADEQYTHVLQMNLSDFTNESAQVRLLILAEPNVRKTLRDVFVTDMPDSAQIDILERLRTSYPRSGLIRYWLGRRLYHQGRFRQSHEVLARVSESLAPNFLRYLTEFTQGLNLYYVGQFQRAKMYFWKSLNFTRSKYHQNAVNDWILRCDWMSELGGSYLDSQ